MIPKRKTKPKMKVASPAMRKKTMINIKMEKHPKYPTILQLSQVHHKLKLDLKDFMKTTESV